MDRMKDLRAMTGAQAARRFDWLEETQGRRAAEEFEARWAKANRIDEDEAPMVLEAASEHDVVESRSVARRLAASSPEQPVFARQISEGDAQELSRQVRDERIRDKVRGFFAEEKAAVSLTIEFDRLFFAVDRELNVSQPFATQAAAQALADRWGEELVQIDERRARAKRMVVRDDVAFEDQMLDEPRIQREIQEGRR